MKRRLPLHLGYQVALITIGLLLSVTQALPRLFHPFDSQLPEMGFPVILLLVPIVGSVVLFQVAYHYEHSPRFWVLLTWAQNLSALAIVGTAALTLGTRTAFSGEVPSLLVSLNLVLHCPLPGDETMPAESELASPEL